MRQAELANFPVFRTFYIDGSIPSPAFMDAPFSYCLHFENQTVKNENGEAALLHLTKGPHPLYPAPLLDSGTGSTPLPLRPRVFQVPNLPLETQVHQSQLHPKLMIPGPQKRRKEYTSFIFPVHKGSKHAC